MKVEVLENIITKSVHFNCIYTGWSKSLCAPDDDSTKNSQNYFKHFQSLTTMWNVLYWTRSSRTQFGVSINVWRLAEDTLNITCNFLYCNRQVQRDFLITLYYSSVSFSNRSLCAAVCGGNAINTWCNIFLIAWTAIFVYDLRSLDKLRKLLTLFKINFLMTWRNLEIRTTFAFLGVLRTNIKLNLMCMLTDFPSLSLAAGNTNFHLKNVIVFVFRHIYLRL
jgi:hypothetical protein